MLQEIQNMLYESSDIYILNMEKCDAYIEAYTREYEINLKEAELKVITENGTDSDLIYLREAADETLLDKMGKGIEKIFSAISNFFKNIIEKFTSLFKKNEEKLDEAEKIIKANPELANKKIEIPDVKASEKAGEEAKGKIAKLLAKLKAGKNVDDREIEEVKTTFLKKHKAALAAGTVVTLVAAIGLAKRYGKGTGNSIQTDFKAVADFFKNLLSHVRKPMKSSSEIDNRSDAVKLAQLEADINKAVQTGRISATSAIIKFIGLGYRGEELQNRALSVANQEVAVQRGKYGEDAQNKSLAISNQEVASMRGKFGQKNQDRMLSAKNQAIAAMRGKITESSGDVYTRLLRDPIYDDIMLYYEAEEENPLTVSGDNTDVNGDAGHATEPVENTKSESGPDIDDDPWTDVIDNDPEEDIDVECGANCGGYGCATEGYSDKFAEIIEDINKAGLGSKPSNESILSSLYGNLGSGNEVEDKGQMTKESTFELLLEAIDSLNY